MSPRSEQRLRNKRMALLCAFMEVSQSELGSARFLSTLLDNEVDHLFSVYMVGELDIMYTDDTFHFGDL